MSKEMVKELKKKGGGEEKIWVLNSFN